MPRKISMKAIIASLRSPKTPAALKRGLLKKYGHLLQGEKLPMSALSTTVVSNPRRRYKHFRPGDTFSGYKIVNLSGHGGAGYIVESLRTGKRSEISEEDLHQLRAEDASFRRRGISNPHKVLKQNMWYKIEEVDGGYVIRSKTTGLIVTKIIPNIHIVDVIFSSLSKAKTNPHKKRKPRSPYDTVGEVYRGKKNPKNMKSGDTFYVGTVPYRVMNKLDRDTYRVKSLRTGREYNMDEQELESYSTFQKNPYPHEHAVRLMQPRGFIRYRRQNDKFGKGVHAIWGIERGTPYTDLQAIRFDARKFTKEGVIKWLKKHGAKSGDILKIEWATGVSMARRKKVR